MKPAKLFFKLIILILIIYGGYFYASRYLKERQELLKIIERLSADSRVAEVIVSGTRFDPAKNITYTTIKFLEYDTKLAPLEAKYFTFSGNIIQFQALVIRFDDFYVKKGDSLRGKSAYIFTKVFTLKNNEAEVFDINKVNEVPSGYRLARRDSNFEKKLWGRFWDYALNAKSASGAGIKNAQVEAPGAKFIPGIIYTIKIEHDGGLRIDSKPIPDILK